MSLVARPVEFPGVTALWSKPSARRRALPDEQRLEKRGRRVGPPVAYHRTGTNHGAS